LLEKVVNPHLRAQDGNRIDPRRTRDLRRDERDNQVVT
jgi:hypothetical protein